MNDFMSGPKKPKPTFGDVMLGIPAGRGGERAERKDKKQGQTDQHRSEAEKTHLPVCQFDHAAECIPPDLRCHEWQEAFQHEHQRERCNQAGHFDLPTAPEPFRYLKNSLVGSTTSTSDLLRKLLRYASRLR